MVRIEIDALVAQYGVERVGLFDLTVPDHIAAADPSEFQRRWNSFATNVLKGLFVKGVAVRERSDKGRLHMHCVVVCRDDIASGFSHTALKAGRRCCPQDSPIRALWARLHDVLPRYGFGRHRLAPVREKDAVARYVAKYVTKNIRCRPETDKGTRRVSFFGYAPGTRVASPHFSFLSERSWAWRQKLGAFCGRFGVPDMDVLRSVVGRNWCYLLKDEILLQPLPAETVYPSFHLAESASMARAGLEQHAILRESCALRGWSYGTEDERVAEALQALDGYRRGLRPESAFPPSSPVAEPSRCLQPLLLLSP